MATAAAVPLPPDDSASGGYLVCISDLPSEIDPVSTVLQVLNIQYYFDVSDSQFCIEYRSGITLYSRQTRYTDDAVSCIEPSM